MPGRSEAGKKRSARGLARTPEPGTAPDRREVRPASGDWSGDQGPWQERSDAAGACLPLWLRQRDGCQAVAVAQRERPLLRLPEAGESCRERQVTIGGRRP